MERFRVASSYLLALALAFAAACTGAARADGVSGDVGLVVDAVAVRHAIDNRPETFDAPLPFLTADVAYRRFSLDAEGLSTLGPLTFGDQATDLDVLLYSARYAVLGPVYAGIGVTSLNQTSVFAPETITTRIDAYETERSHLYGTRFETGFVLPRMRLDLGFTPSIHGTVFDRCVQTDRILTTPCYFAGITTENSTASETASEFDAAYRYFVPLAKRVDLIVGARYVNFIGRVPSSRGTDIDQNRAAPILSVGLQYDFP